MGVLDLVGKAAKGAKKAAPFFSKADVVLDELPRGKGLGNEFLGELVKKGAKPTELRERGIEKALKDKPKMTKAEVQKVFESKPAPKVQEKVLSSDVPDYDEWLENKAQEIYGVDWFDLRKDEQSRLNKMYGDLELTQYDRYKTPGGENYREILLKLPSFDSKRLMELEADIRRSEGAYKDPMSMPDFRAKVEELAQLKEQQAAAGAPYISSHYKTDPNLLAHIRVQDFTTPEGKKVLLVDEIQSDWHQEGRKKGYKLSSEETAPMDSEYRALIHKNSEARAVGLEPDPKDVERAEQLEDALIKADSSKIPDAPFKKNWHELAMKRVLDYAAENGYDTVAITPGAEQAKRYDLSKQIDAIEWNPEKGRLYAKQKNSSNFDKMADDVTPENLADYIGKEAAEKLIAQPYAGSYKQLNGVDLQVGGEGMKGFYDKILPDYLNNFGKQYGASVREAPLNYTPSTKQVAQGAQDDALLGQLGVDVPTVAPTQYHMFDITPQLREEVKNKGLPMYGKVSMPVLEGLAAGSGAATIGSQMFDENNEQQVQNPVHFTENPDAMLLELMQRN